MVCSVSMSRALRFAVCLRDVNDNMAVSRQYGSKHIDPCVVSSVDGVDIQEEFDGRCWLWVWVMVLVLTDGSSVFSWLPSGLVLQLWLVSTELERFLQIDTILHF